MQVLEEAGVLRGITRFAGSGFGAIVVTLLALEFPPALVDRWLSAEVPKLLSGKISTLLAPSLRLLRICLVGSLTRCGWSVFRPCPMYPYPTHPPLRPDARGAHPQLDGNENQGSPGQCRRNIRSGTTRHEAKALLLNETN